MAKHSIDTRAMCCMRPSDLVHQHKQFIQTNDTTALDDHSDHLLRLVEYGALIPHVYTLWLRVAGERQVRHIVAAMTHQQSRYLRKEAIKTFAKLLRRPAWRETWNAAGDTAGLVEIFSELSVDHVSLLTQNIAKACEKPSVRTEELASKVEELITALVPDVFSNSSPTPGDRRSLAKAYFALLPACGPRFVRNFLLSPAADKLKTMIPVERLAIVHEEVFQVEFLHDADRWPFSRAVDLVLDCNTPRPDFVGNDNHAQFVLRIIEQPKRHLVRVLDRLLNALYFRRTKLPHLRPIAELAIRVLQNPNNTASFGEDITVGQLCKYLNAAAAFWAKVHRRKEPAEYDVAAADSLLHTIANYFPREQLLIHLKNTVRFYPEEGSHTVLRGSSHETLYTLTILRHCVQPLRYKLLHTVFLLCKPHNIDLHSQHSLKHESCPTEWSGGLFLKIEKKEGAALFRRLFQTQANFTVHAGRSNSPHVWWPLSGDDYPYFAPSIRARNMSLLLIDSSEERHHEAEKEIKWRKTKAQSTSDATQRAIWACAVVQCSIASRSLHLYDEVVIWSRRYVRDWLTLKELYQFRIMQQPELSSMLAVIPRYNTAAVDLEHLQEDVQLANRVIKNHFDLVCEALHEPSFNAADWSELRSLVEMVVDLRIRTLRDVRNHTLNTEIMGVVLPPTMELLLDLETLCLEAGHENLGFRNTNGLLNFDHFNFGGSLDLTSEDFPPQVYKFLDELAASRDHLWQQIRKNLCPDVLSLPPVWPRGLSVQTLLPGVTLSLAGTHERMPYVNARLRQVLCIDETGTPGLVVGIESLMNMQLSNANQEAIGVHVNSFGFALRCYMRDACKTEKDIREKLSECFELCMKFTVGTISNNRQISTEFISKHRQRRGWLNILCEIFPEHRSSLKKIWNGGALPYLEPLPRADELADEWSPYAALSEEPKDVDRPIDSMLHAEEGATAGIEGQFPLPLHQYGWIDLRRTPPLLPKFNYREPRLSEPVVRESAIIFALLYLDRASMSSARFLTTAFPESDNSRYPPLFLADEFLSDNKHGFNEAEALGVLDRFVDFVPPALLERLLSRLCHRLEKIGRTNSTFATLQTLMFKVLQLQARSEHPEAAMSRTTEIFLHNSRASSWYRYLISSGYCKRMMASNAIHFIDALVDGFLKQTDSGDKMIAAKIVTKGKLISRLLVSGGFLSLRAVLGYLLNIIQSAKHVDLVAVTVRSLLGIFASVDSDEKSLENAIVALQTIIQRAAGPNERRAILEEQWQQAEAGEKLSDLPSVTLQQSQDETSVARVLFIDAAELVPESLQHLFVKKILLPVVDTAVANQTRWMRAFIHKYDRHVVVPEVLEQRPFHSFMVSTLLNHWVQYVPKKYLQLELNMVLTPAAIKLFPDINAAADASRKEADNNAQQYWLQVMATTTSDVVLGRTLLKWPPSKLPTGEGIEVSDIQQHLSSQFDCLLQAHHSDAEKYVTDLESFLWSMWIPPSHTLSEHVEKVSWNSTVKPMLRNMISDIDALRTPQWQRDPKRWPTLLPDTYPMKLWLLPYPNWPHLQDDPNEYERFVSTVLAELKKILASNKPYEKRLLQLTDAILNSGKRHYLEIAVRLPRSEPDPGSSATLGAEMYTEQLLRCEMAVTLMKKVCDPEPGDLVDKVNCLLTGWSRCPTEEARVLAFETKKILRDPRYCGWLL